MSKILDLHDLLSKIDHEIVEQRTRTVALIDESQERMLALQLKRAKLADALEAVSPAVLVSPQEKTSVAPASAVSASEAILAALKATEGKGLTNIELREALQKDGISASASDKARGRLKGAGRIKLENDRWVLEAGAEAVDVVDPKQADSDAQAPDGN
ncbi:hypothetical protein NLM16_08970 [Bradyrhizobium brasilense]|uniref:hypothetical protein n=1 Tax=Bradyrhizobium brasilense TaxID=1419277 RepID=UPI0028780EB6|nr:hypothetical protein [Bradyrhizobium brasilense]MCP3414230.1 hypothetical protein [Bradyrhizobium brasilense]